MDDMIAVRRAVDRLLGGDLEPMLDLLAEDVRFEVAGGGDSPEYRTAWGKEAVADYFAALGELVAFWQIDYGAEDGQVIAWGRESFRAEPCGLEGGCEFALVFEMAGGEIGRFLVIEDLVSFFRHGGVELVHSESGAATAVLSRGQCVTSGRQRVGSPTACDDPMNPRAESVGCRLEVLRARVGLVSRRERRRHGFDETLNGRVASFNECDSALCRRVRARPGRVERMSSRKSLPLTRLMSVEQPRGIAEGARGIAQQVSGSARPVRGDAHLSRPIAAFALSPVEAAKSIAESMPETVHIVRGVVEEARGSSPALQELAHPMR